MARVFVWSLCAVFSVLIVRGRLNAQPLSAPEEVKVYTEDGVKDFGAWEMNIEWKDGFTNSITPDKVTYDIKIFYTEQMKLVHNETIELKANQTGHYKWSWISPLPLQCTSHSVQLRYRDRDLTSAWTPLTTLPGRDIPDIKDIRVYPQNRVALVSEGIRFCCILKPEHDGQFKSSLFTLRISNQTYVTEPIRHSHPSPPEGFDIICEGEGSTYYTDYAPDDHSITCETRDLSSVECHWIKGHRANVSEELMQPQYFINGRNCSPGFCVLENTIDTGLVNWTLTAKNILGTKIIFDTADPKHRVHLKAPTLAPTTLFTARNATLEWKWHGLSKCSSFPMICQVEVNGRIINETFNGTGLTSVVLADLQPFTEYKARVRCGSLEHFYKWGDWSNLITFVTKEDIPEALDVWMQVFGEQTYVVWKNLTRAQRHGIITSYELVMGSSRDRNEETVESPANCHKLQKTYHVISVSARNSAGVSRPSSITIPNLSPDGGVNISDIKGNNGAFDMVWEPSPRSRCGYVIDWYPTYEAQCAVKWIKIPSDVSSAKICSDKDFKEGVKYTLSVYGCPSGAPELLQRREGYMTELPPLGAVQNLKAEQEGLNIYLSWGSVREQEQRGFIKGYIVSYSHAGREEVSVNISDPSTQKYKFSLPVDTYTFTVKALTSAGPSPGSVITLSMDPRVDQVIMNVVPVLALMIFILCVIAVLAYRNWKWLWPEVPKPMLSEEFLKKIVYQGQVMDQLVCEESEVLKVKSPEVCPAITVLELQEELYEAQTLNSPHSKDSSWSENYQTPNSNPQTLPLIDVDLSYKELPCPGIQNPTYNMPSVPPAKVLPSVYMPQIQNGSIPHQPSDAHCWSHSPSNMSEMQYQDNLIM
ncbi:LIF receptor subunit alpha b [Pangasianodon hypophthalmus]|uniref:LIF receptor subunit alpha b n=1 Tax=Pangasianodon hypophthalmus TaxID=310915 RepID=UPI0023077745|nr:LIF receptor subunit alpha b [Pangasianodon hypophthalmus]XP_026797255.3 LIF receptor subunit alpha b [Pangasianodon hypophthalmus]